MGAEHAHLVEVLEVPRPTDADNLLERLTDVEAGIMPIADVLPDTAVAALHRKGTSITLVSHRVPDLEVPAIVHDNRHGIELLASEVFERCGRVMPLYIGGSARQQDSSERENAFRRELMRRGLPIEEARFLSGAFEPGQAAAALSAYLEGGGELDALVAADYLMAIACGPLKPTNQQIPVRSRRSSSSSRIRRNSSATGSSCLTSRSRLLSR